MILLDTSVVSEPLRAAPEARVIEWIDAQPLETLFLSAITVAELRADVALLPAGKRRAGLLDNLEKRVLPLFAGRVLPFDVACTQACNIDGQGAGHGARHSHRRWLHRRHRRCQPLCDSRPRHRPLRGRRGGCDQPLAGLKDVIRQRLAAH